MYVMIQVEMDLVQACSQTDAFPAYEQRSEGSFTDIIACLITVCHLVMSDESICVGITHKRESPIGLPFDFRSLVLVCHQVCK